MTSAIIYSTSLTKRLSSSEVRLPPTFIGVRRVRPTSRLSREEFFKQRRTQYDLLPQHHASPDDTDANNGSEIDNAPSDPDQIDLSEGGSSDPPAQNPWFNEVVYKTKDENGLLRRMSKQEKKELKYRRQAERQAAKKLVKAAMKKKRSESIDPTICAGVDGPSIVEASNEGKEETSSDRLKRPSNELEESQWKRYFYLQLSKEGLEQELAELRGERRVPPVILSEPMVRQAIRRGALTVDAQTHINKKESLNVVVDDELAEQWAESIRQSMIETEVMRSKEKLRPMAYQLSPEKWSRLRPPVHIQQTPLINADTTASADRPLTEWSPITTRPTSTHIDTHFNIIVEQLSNMKNVHVSCGAKFGCDFLLYDGNREERHAFAGLRVLRHPLHTRRADSPPIPTAYDVAGFVRGLNTAGKLALLATVVETKAKEDDCVTYRVVFVDLALEKILEAPTHQRKYKKHKLQERKEVGKNLSKR